MSEALLAVPGLLEELAASGVTEGEEVEEARKQESAYYGQAYEGFIKAIANESFPMCGMEESTVNVLLANMAYKLGKYDVSAKLVSTILTSRTASRIVKDKALNLKQEIVKRLHKA